MKYLLFVTLLLTAACDGFDPPSQVRDTRLLAVRAEPAEVGPGATVALDTLIANPSGEALTFAWYACILPQLGDVQGGGQPDGTPSDDSYGGSCHARVDAGLPFAVALGTDATAALTIPATLFDDDDALRLGFGFDATTAIPDALRQILLSIAGLNYTVELVITTPDRQIEVQKAVNVSLADDPADGTSNPKNLNPDAPLVHPSDHATPTAAPSAPVAVPARCFPAGALTPMAGHVYDLLPLQVPNPEPQYQVLVLANTGDIPFQIEQRGEKSFYAFFATRGTFDADEVKTTGEGAKNVWHLGKSDVGPTDLWVVLRDGRGGIAWCHEPLVIGGP